MDARPGPSPRTVPWWLRGSVVTRVAIVMLALVLLRMAGSAVYEWRLFEQGSISEVEGLARRLEVQASRDLDSVDETLAGLAVMLTSAREPALDHPRQELLNLAAASNRLLRGLSLVDGQGRVLASSLPTLVGQVIDLTHIALPALGQAGQLGSPLPGLRSHALNPLNPLAPSAAASGPAGAADRAVLPMARAVHAPGQPRRYLVAALNPEQLDASLDLGTPYPGLGAALLRANGEVIASTAGLAALRGHSVSAHPELGPWMAPSVSVQPTTRAQGERAYSAVRALHNFPLTVAVMQDQKQAFVRQLQDRLILRGFTDLLALMLFCAGWFTLAKHVQARESMAAALLVNDDRLQRSERALGLMLESVRELIFRADALGCITFVNRRWESSTGYRSTDILGQHLADLVDPADRLRVEALFRPGSDAPADPVLVRMRGRNEVLSLDLSVTPMADTQGGNPGYVGIAYDLTERQTVRERLQDRLDFAMRLLDVSPTAMFAKDTEGRYIEVNRAFLEMVGLSLHQVIGKTAESLFPDADGRQTAADRHVLGTGERVTYERLLGNPDGSVRNTRITKSRLNYGNGKPAGIVGSSVDVTVYRQAEKAIRDARDASLAAAKAKLAFERGFLSMAAHELRTPLTSLRLQAELIVDAPTAAERRGLSKDLLASVDRIGHVLEQLMSLSRVDGLRYAELDLVRVDLEATYFKVMSLLQEEAADRGIRLRSRLHGSHVTGVEFGIYTLMRNLLHNAILYTPPDGQIHIEARTVGGAQVLTVDDSGPGIPADQRELAFERFNRLGQQQIKGSGLGLSIVKTIASLHGASIRLDQSALGGLRVVVEFPIERPALPAFLDSTLMDTADTQPAPL